MPRRQSGNTPPAPFPFFGNIPAINTGRNEQTEELEYVREKLAEYKIIRRNMRTFHSAKNKHRRAKYRLLKQKKERYKKRFTEVEEFNHIFRDRIGELEDELGNSTTEVAQLHLENQYVQERMANLRNDSNQAKEQTYQLNEEIEKINRQWNLKMKSVLRGKHAAEQKLHRVWKNFASKMIRTNRLKESTLIMMKNTVKKLKIELDEKAKLYDESKAMLKEQEEKMMEADRKVIEINEEMDKLKNENEKLSAQNEDQRLKLLDIEKDYKLMEIKMEDVKGENEKQRNEWNEMKKITEHEMSLLLQDIEEKNNLLAQKEELISLMKIEKIENRRTNMELMEKNRTMGHALRVTEATLQAQHQELQIHEANWKAREKEIDDLKEKYDDAKKRGKFLETENQLLLQNSGRNNQNFLGIHGTMTSMLNNIDNKCLQEISNQNLLLSLITQMRLNAMMQNRDDGENDDDQAALAGPSSE